MWKQIGTILLICGLFQASRLSLGLPWVPYARPAPTPAQGLAPAMTPETAVWIEGFGGLVATDTGIITTTNRVTFEQLQVRAQQGTAAQTRWVDGPTGALLVTTTTLPPTVTTTTLETTTAMTFTDLRQLAALGVVTTAITGGTVMPDCHLHRRDAPSRDEQYVHIDAGGRWPQGLTTKTLVTPTLAVARRD